jgi:hypothetical protein
MALGGRCQCRQIWRAMLELDWHWFQFWKVWWW